MGDTVNDRLTSLETSVKLFREDSLRARDEHKELMSDIKDELKELNENMKEHILFKTNLDNQNQKLNAHIEDDKLFHQQALQIFKKVDRISWVFGVICVPIFLYIVTKIIDFIGSNIL